ncbi:hypothetical protein [Stakelama tenebrarum]|uniref:Uncharacterized protein n=1 Tax=Stakelama tenebrarum TaxID=2711215 RepID=A0A6G6Y1S4_9SPHN|nr:hypothetical protein [Sphingosinithalassobacter tenebrarum]QIG78875.1 hypothetical protein G5C33_03080 [Sphingosinithalassobacter tenebrarum]
MTNYRVGFYNELCDSTGHDHHVCQREILITTEGGEEAAIAKAIAEFERLERIEHWKARASEVKCTKLAR